MGGTTPRSFFRAPDLCSAERPIQLTLTHVEKLKGNVIRLRYEVVRTGGVKSGQED